VIYIVYYCGKVNKHVLSEELGLNLFLSKTDIQEYVDSVVWLMEKKKE
jgi:hypothetical protein